MTKKEDGKPTPKTKIVSLDENQIGKGCLIKRFCEKLLFPQSIPMIGRGSDVRSSEMRSVCTFTNVEERRRETDTED
jgi:hypothetical protein